MVYIRVAVSTKKYFSYGMVEPKNATMTLTVMFQTAKNKLKSYRLSKLKHFNYQYLNCPFFVTGIYNNLLKSSDFCIVWPIWSVTVLLESAMTVKILQISKKMI